MEDDGRRVHYQLKPKGFERVNEPEGQADDKGVDVSQILQQNLERHKATAPPLDLKKPRSRRLRDYLLVMGLGNGFFLGSLVVFWGNPVVMAFALGGAMSLSAGVSWVMWFIMSDY